MMSSPTRRALIWLIIALGALVVALIRVGGRDPDAASAPPAAVELSSATAVAQLEAAVQRDPTNANAYARLGVAYLQRVRETGDPALYTLAQQALDQALTLDPQQLDALVGQGLLATGRHDFLTALDWAAQARAINPYRADILGIEVDAYVELGRYAEAVTAAQAMVDLRPDLSSYSRVAYIRELHGDMAGAQAAMRLAVEAAVVGQEEWAWLQTQLGHLYFNTGQWAEAGALYEDVLRYRADYPYAVAGQARVHAAHGDSAAAVALLEPLVQRQPLPEFVILLGDLYTQTGRLEAAQHQYDLVRVIQQLQVEVGQNLDLELATFEVAYNPDATAALTAAQAAYAQRPTIYAADALAWAWHRLGDQTQAWAYSQEALRLGTQDALLHYHAAAIAAALEDTPAACTHLQTALALNPAFSFREAPAADALAQSLACDD